MRKLVLPLFVLSMSVGCVSRVDFPAQEDLYDEPRDFERFAVFSYGREVVGGQVNQGGVLGLDVNLGRYTDPDDHALRGHVYGRLVNARVGDGIVDGQAASLPFRMAVARDEEGVSGKGLVYGRPVEIRMSDRKTTAVMGDCELDLARHGPLYVGRRRCFGRWMPEEIELQVGRGFTAWSDTERVAALSLMLFGD